MVPPAEKKNLHNVYFSLDTGLCIYERKYGSLQVDGQLVTGAVSAIEMTFQRITETSPTYDSPQVFLFGQYKYVKLEKKIDNGGSLIFLGVCEPDVDDKACAKLAEWSTYAFMTLVDLSTPDNHSKIVEQFGRKMKDFGYKGEVGEKKVMDYIRDEFEKEANRGDIRKQMLDSLDTLGHVIRKDERS